MCFKKGDALFETRIIHVVTYIHDGWQDDTFFGMALLKDDIGSHVDPQGVEVLDDREGFKLNRVLV